MSDLTLDEILTQALELEPAARSDYLAAACAGDPALLAEVESLLSVADKFPARHMAQETTGTGEPAPLPERIGRYPVVGVVGEGGMGLVYRALDPDLEREVALKRLPAGVRDDSAEWARLRREARALARLQHPNIATVYSLESDSGEPFLTMELVPGRTLHAVLTDGPLPLERALGVAAQIAAAMEAAHAEGIVHRDLKPLNIQIGKTDQVKVLDFGLAKALDEPAGNPRAATDGTEPAQDNFLPPAANGTVTISGRVLGTPGYISPEQLLGQPVQPPTDIWAFGCVLFECLTGCSPYRDAGSTVCVPARFRRTLAALELKPDWSQLPAGIPGHIRELLESCLSTEPGERPDAAAVRRSLDRGLAEITAPTWTSWLLSRRGAILLVCMLLAMTGAIFLGERSGPPAEGIPASTVRQLTFHGNVNAYDLAPDGERVAYLDETSQLVYLDIESGQRRAAPLINGAANDTIVTLGARPGGLRWSPSGSELAVVGVRKTKQLTTSTYLVPQGSHTATVLDVPDFAGSVWSPDGSQIAGIRGLGNDAVLCIVDRASGRYHDVPLDSTTKPAHLFDWSLGDKLYTRFAGSDSVYAVPAGGGIPRALLAGIRMRYLPDRDEICLLVDNQFRSFQVDANGIPTASYSILADRVPPIEASPSLAQDGRRILYTNAGQIEVWIGQQTSTPPSEEFRWSPLLRESLVTNAARFSPDGSLIALAGRPAQDVEATLLIYSPENGSRSIVARGQMINYPAWSPDGTELVYSQKQGMYRVKIDGGTPQPVPGPRKPIYTRWLPDGSIIYMERDGDLWSAYSRIDPVDGSISKLPIDPGRGSLFQFAMAPHGKSVAVAGNRGGIYQVKVWLVDLEDGSERLLYDGYGAPFAWSADARWVYVVAESQPESGGLRRTKILRVAVDDGTVEKVTDLSEYAKGWSHFDLSPDERKILYTQRRIGRDLWLMDIEPTRD
jgi:Tol biopolymer transport system component